MAEGLFGEELARTQSHWLTDFVDDEHGGIYSSIRANGQVADPTKANYWKNGFHAAEHALIMYIHEQQAAEDPVSLYFAVPAREAESFTAVPYLFSGDEISREILDTIEVGGDDLTRVRVTFDNIH
jgi:predicted heme/steroid binding protein